MSKEVKNIKENKCIVKADGTVKSFEEITISTKTVIGISNLRINLDNFFKYMPITDYIPVQKKRGRRRRIQINSNKNIVPYGSIINISRKKEVRGAILKNKKKSKNDDSEEDEEKKGSRVSNDKDYFLHSVSLVIVLEDGKQINMKVSSNGKLQITGCKYDEHFINAVISLYKTMIEVEEWTNEKIFEKNGDLEIVFNTVMQNMDFNVGFNINRHKLDSFINRQTQYRSIFEGSLLSGVNIKVKSDPTVYPTIMKIVYNLDEDKITKSYTSYDIYKTLLDKKKETKKDKYHTFLVFASGSVIMSSGGSEMKEVYNNIVNILIRNREHFEDQKYVAQEWSEDEEDIYEDEEDD